MTEEEKNTNKEKDTKKEIKVTPYKNGDGAKIDIYSPDSQTKPHDTIHVKVNTETGEYQTITKIDGNKETSSGSCYLTTACMKFYLNDFDDNCYELTVLRWFRDNFVSKEDIKHYYDIAPYIVKGIEYDDNKNLVYDYIYDNIVDYCVKKIENGDYIAAYTRYKESILSLEQTYAQLICNYKLIKTLNK